MSSSTCLRVELVEFFLGLFVEELAGLEGLADGFAEIFQGLVAVELLEAGAVGVVEAGVEQEVGEGLHEVFEAEGGGEVAGEFGVADALHRSSLIHSRPAWGLVDPAGVDYGEFGAAGFGGELLVGEWVCVGLLF